VVDPFQRLQAAVIAVDVLGIAPPQLLGHPLSSTSSDSPRRRALPVVDSVV
jgi:hypothetical protein